VSRPRPSSCCRLWGDTRLGPGYKKGATGVAPFVHPEVSLREAYGFFVAVSFFMLVSIFIVLSIFMVVSAAGAGAIAGGAAAVSRGVSSLVLQAARASTAATRARRFIYILLEGDDQRLPWSAHAVPGSAAESTESGAGVKAINVVQVQGQQCVYRNGPPPMQASSLSHSEASTTDGVTGIGTTFLACVRRAR
jgi:hypothetical protein